MAFARHAPHKLHAWLRRLPVLRAGAEALADAVSEFRREADLQWAALRDSLPSLPRSLCGQGGEPAWIGVVGLRFAVAGNTPGAGASSNVPRPMMAIADGDAAQAGEAVGSFDEIYARYEKQIFNAIYQWIGDYDEASDLTQETFVSAYRALDQFRGESRIYTWLYRIAYNHCKNRFKQRDRQRQMEGLSLDAGVTDGDGDELVSETREIADWSYSPARILEQKELRALVDRAVDSLASEYKVVLLLRELNGLSYQEIAEVTGLTMEAVKTRLNRARGMVRQRVEPYYKT